MRQGGGWCFFGRRGVMAGSERPVFRGMGGCMPLLEVRYTRSDDPEDGVRRAGQREEGELVSGGCCAATLICDYRACGGQHFACSRPLAQSGSNESLGVKGQMRRQGEKGREEGSAGLERPRASMRTGHSHAGACGRVRVRLPGRLWASQLVSGCLRITRLICRPHPGPSPFLLERRAYLGKRLTAWPRMGRGWGGCRGGGGRGRLDWGRISVSIGVMGQPTRHLCGHHYSTRAAAGVVV